MEPHYVHPSADVDATASIGAGTRIWNWAKVREHAAIGERCSIGQGAYIDHEVVVGADCKIQNYAMLYYGVSVGDRVFIGPHATFTNDQFPRATGDWSVTPTIVESDASVGANATVVCGTRLGRGCMIGAGSVVVADVPPGAVVVGNPARIVRFVEPDDD